MKPKYKKLTEREQYKKLIERDLGTKAEQLSDKILPNEFSPIIGCFQFKFTISRESILEDMEEEQRGDLIGRVITELESFAENLTQELQNYVKSAVEDNIEAIKTKYHVNKSKDNGSKNP